MTVASDESYRDPTNLQSKLQKHAAFQAELSSNKGRVDSVTEVCVASFSSYLGRRGNVHCCSVNYISLNYLHKHAYPDSKCLA